MTYSSGRTFPWPNADVIDPSSRVPASQHHPALAALLKLQISMDLMEYVVDCVVDVTCAALGSPHRLGAPSELKQASLVRFVTNVIFRSRVPVATILVTLAYLDKARGYIQVAMSKWICERIFLGAFLAAHKYTNDSWMRAKTWAQITGVFAATDVVRVEREFLGVLEFKLRVDENALLVHHDGIMARCAPYAGTWSGRYTPPSLAGSPVSPIASKPMPPTYLPSYPPCYDLECSSAGSSRSASPLDTPPVTTPPTQTTISPFPHERKPFPAYNGSYHHAQLHKPEFASGGHITSDSTLRLSVHDMMDRYFPVDPAAPSSEDYDRCFRLPPSQLPAAGSHQSRRDSHPTTLPHITEILPPSILYPSSSHILTSWP